MKSLLFAGLFLLTCFSSPAQRILSYNIRNAKGMDNITDYDRVADAINKNKPDIVALQELDSVTQRSKGVDVLKTLAERTGMQHTFSASIDFSGGKYGVGLLSKEKPLQVTRVALPGREERRSLLVVAFRDYVVFCTHLSLTPVDQVTSAQIINEQVKQYNKPVYLAGDLNATPDSAPIETLKTTWTLLSGTANTFPANAPNRCIDYVFGYNVKKKPVETTVPDEPLASDHRPVLVVIK